MSEVGEESQCRAMVVTHGIALRNQVKGMGTPEGEAWGVGNVRVCKKSGVM